MKVATLADTLVGRFFFVNLPRVLLLAAFVYAPWAYGCSNWFERPRPVEILSTLLGFALLLWIGGCAVRRLFPRVHAVFGAATLFILAYGWAVTLNAHGLYDDYYRQFVPLDSPWEKGPGSVDKAVSTAMMLRLSALLGAAWMAADVAARGPWRRALVWTVALAGASIAVLGLVQKATGAPGIFWQFSWPPYPFFGTFKSHNNAGAFLNLTWPLAAGLCAAAFRSDGRHGARALWTGALAMMLASVFVNVSRAAMALAVVMFVGLAGWLAAGTLKRHWETRKTQITAFAVLSLLAVGIMVAAGGWRVGWTRWNQLTGQIGPENPRLRAFRVCVVDMLPDSGVFGFGPGTWHLKFPAYQSRHPGSPNYFKYRWQYAHQDWLQTAIEWGWLGSTGWAVLLLGGCAGGWWNCARFRTRKEQDRPAASTPEDRILLVCICTALTGVLLHSLVDFPLQVTSLQLYAFTLAALAWNSYRWNDGY